jgi:lysozyme
VTKDDPKTQFKNFSENISLAKGDLPPVIDIETLTDGGSAHLTQDLDTFLKLLTQKYKSPPILYSGEYFASEHLSSFGKYPLWIAEYSDVSSPKLPSGWTTWTFWQHTQSGSVKGVEGRVDLDRFNGSLSDLHDLTIQ